MSFSFQIMTESTASSAASSLARSEIQPTINPPSSNIVFTVPNMNHTLQIKLSNADFPSWRTQIMAYVKAQDAYDFLDGTSKPPI
jgi:hypothetical protein